MTKHEKREHHKTQERYSNKLHINIQVKEIINVFTNVIVSSGNWWLCLLIFRLGALFCPSLYSIHTVHEFYFVVYLKIKTYIILYSITFMQLHLCQHIIHTVYSDRVHSPVSPDPSSLVNKISIDQHSLTEGTHFGNQFQKIEIDIIPLFCMVVEQPRASYHTELIFYIIN